MTGRLASSCRAISPTAEDTPLTTIAPQSARSSQAMAEAASPKRMTTTQRRCRGASRSNVFQSLRGFVEPDAIQAQFVDDMQGARTDCDIDAKLRRPSVKTAPICQGERDLAIPHDCLHVDTQVLRDPIDATLDDSSNGRCIRAGGEHSIEGSAAPLRSVPSRSEPDRQGVVRRSSSYPAVPRADDVVMHRATSAPKSRQP